MLSRAAASVVALTWACNSVAGLQADDLLLLSKVCTEWSQGAVPPAEFGALLNRVEIKRQGRVVGDQFNLRRNEALFEFSAYDLPGRPPRFVLLERRADGLPAVQVVVGDDCQLRSVHQISYRGAPGSPSAMALNIIPLDAALNVSGDPEWLNPPLELAQVPRLATDTPTAVRVAMVDSGVNYRLPVIRDRLAVDKNGIIGFDFWDMDALPFDAQVLGNGFLVQRHGTRTASLMLREAPGVELVPYRYPRPDMTRMRDLIEHADDHGVVIIGMPLGSDTVEDWSAFQKAASAHPHLLFIVSAGNNGRDIDRQPVYPAALDLQNVIVVSSADDFVRPAERANWGRSSVDFLVPAESVLATDYSGQKVFVSGSSYAVSRVVALAARLLQQHPAWRAPDLIRELRRRYTDGIAKQWVSSGYIADPLAGDSVTGRRVGSIHSPAVISADELVLPLDILILDPRWTEARVRDVMAGALLVLRQCALQPGEISLRLLEGPDYLRDLATGSARTLMDALRTPLTTVVFARDTRMQEPFSGEAFGQANTQQRPWLTQSVWLTEDVRDPALALAHELVHILTNSGEHVTADGNLMQGRTDSLRTQLTTAQCTRLRRAGLAAGLLLPP